MYITVPSCVEIHKKIIHLLSTYISPDIYLHNLIMLIQKRHKNYNNEITIYIYSIYTRYFVIH